ncbi:hypothetical protein FACS1894158_15840 [Betaproteobacteria bacterium]|nr:hypothetical protein FACS1894158_15840 [Betaproteobacteria bacterium]
MNTVSSLVSTPASSPPPLPATKTNTPTSTGGVPGKDTFITASPEPQISPTARALAKFYEAASAFVQKEHFEPFTGWKYSNGSSGYVLNNESAYLDVEKYNNYLFDKAATTLVDQARQMGLALDKKETIAQLKADNAEVAAIRYSDMDRVKNLNVSVSFSKLTMSDVNSLTDMYIKAKENGLDATQMGDVAFHLGNRNHDRESGIIFLENDFDASYFDRIQNKTDMAGIIKAKLADTTFGFSYEKEFFEQLLNPRLHLGGVNDKTLNFLLQMLDIYSPDSEPTESWKWDFSTGWSSTAMSRP